MVYVPIDLIEVRAWGYTVGAIAATNQRGAYAFEYDPLWMRRNIELAPALMPLVRRIYTFPGLAKVTYQGLPPMIADALPDKFGNTIVDAWLARNGISKEDVTALDRLAYLGNRGMGALEFLPDRQPNLPKPSALDIGELVLSARRAVEGSLASELESQDALQRIIDVGTSAGGARAKAIVNINAITGEIRSGHLPPASGFEPWIIKFDGINAENQLGHGQNFGRVEYAYSLMAAAAGINMSETRILEEHDRAHFMTRRFDRLKGGERLHLQSLCATDALDFNAIGVNDYAQYFSRVQAFGLGGDDLVQAYRRMVFNVAAANYDDHTKNFAFLMDKTGVWQLAPAYDVTHAYASSSVWLSQHLMSVNGKFDGITRADLIAVAERFSINGASAIFTQVNEALASWSQFAITAGLSAESIAVIARDFSPISKSMRSAN